MTKVISAVLCILVAACGDAKPVGSVCKHDDDCQTGECHTEMTPIQNGLDLPNKDLPGGLCSIGCEADWDVDPQGSCLDGEICVTWLAGPGLCFLTCEQDSDCGRDDYECVGIGFEDDHACLPKKGN